MSATASPLTQAELTELEAERQRLTNLKKESAQVLAYHDLRRKGLAATDNLYQTLLEDIDQQLAASPNHVR